ncbi:MAG: hypothetical protein V4819_01660 [Verrucomicrobiota bacterium]
MRPLAWSEPIDPFHSGTSDECTVTDIHATETNKFYHVDISKPWQRLPVATDTGTPIRGQTLNVRYSGRGWSASVRCSIREEDFVPG